MTTETSLKPSDKDSTQKLSSNGGGSTSSKPSSPRKAKSIRNIKETGKKVELINRTNRNIELDFGRDKEVRIKGNGGRALMDAAYLEHPRFLAEKGNLSVKQT